MLQYVSWNYISDLETVYDSIKCLFREVLKHIASSFFLISNGNSFHIFGPLILVDDNAMAEYPTARYYM